jgi:methylthioribose-1-phosphate isomerase
MIPIEQRKAEEVLGVSGGFGQDLPTIKWAPQGSPVYNPAFDVTPAELTTGWILDNGSFTQNDIKSGALQKRN